MIDSYMGVNGGQFSDGSLGVYHIKHHYSSDKL